MDRLRELIPQEFLDSELAELKAHKFRIAALFFSMIGLLIVVFVDDAETVSKSTVIVEKPLEEESRGVEISDPKSDRRAEIIGLARASEDVKLINPFAVDLPKPPPEPIVIPITAPPPPPKLSAPPLESKQFEKKSIEKITSAPIAPRILLTLKGTAISDEKKIAVVHREIVTAKSDEKSGGSVENRLLKIGEVLDGRTVVDIGRDFVAFDDGERLELSRIQP